MNHLLLTVRLLLLLYLGYLTLFLLSEYNPVSPAFRPPFVLWILDLINLYIHEAGHLFFGIFGRWMHFIGGSAFQVLVPAALLVVTWRQNAHQIALPAWWMGQSMINVSVYIADAPYRKLKLISKGATHDWGWLLAGNVQAAEPISQTVFWLGMVICVSALGVGGFFAVKQWRAH
jgi:hypothetical protein